MLSKHTILVTGGAGFIGSHLVKKLAEMGHEIIVIDNFNPYYDPKLKEARIREFLKDVPFTLYRADIENYTALEQIFKKHKIDYVCHQAAQAGVRYAGTVPFKYARTNFNGTLNLLELARMFKIKGMVLASSSSVYGDTQQFPLKEEQMTDKPVSLYAATKKSGELIAHAYHRLYNTPITCLRYFTVYGPWGRPDMAYFKFTKSILNGEPIDVYGQGDMERDFTYIDDIVDGVVQAIQKNNSWEIINLGQGNPDSLGKFIGLIEQNLGKEAVKNYLPMQPGDMRRTYADINKAKELLDWQPKVRLEDGMKRFLDWYVNFHNETNNDNVRFEDRTLTLRHL